MTYYKVTAAASQTRKPKSFDILIANEVYTEKEFTKMGMPSTLFEKIAIAPKNTYFFFGARFQKVN